MIIGLTGDRGIGKSTVANILKEAGYMEYSFALPIKEGLMKITGLSYEELDSQEYKEKPISWLGVTPRDLFRTMGTLWGRNMINPDIWTIIAKRRMMGEYAGKNIIISDVRFENELNMIRDMGGIIIHIKKGDSLGFRAVNYTDLKVDNWILLKRWLSKLPVLSRYIVESDIPVDMCIGDYILSNDKTDIGMLRFQVLEAEKYIHRYRC